MLFTVAGATTSGAESTDAHKAPHKKTRLKIHKASLPEEQYSSYAVATYLQKRGKPEAALAFKELNACNPPLCARDSYFQHLFDTYQFGEIIAQEEKIKTEFKGNIDLLLLLAQAYLFTNNDQKAENLFTQLRQETPFNEQVIYYSVVHYLKQNKETEALAILNGFLDKADLRPKHAMLYFFKSKILLSLNKTQEALTAIEKSLELYPQFDKACLFKAVLMEQLGRVNDAISGYQQFLAITPGDATIEKQLIGLLFAQKRFSEAATTLRTMKSDLPEYHFDLALIEWKAGNLAHAEDEISKALAKNPGFEKAILLKTEILLAHNKPSEAVKHLEHWIMNNVDNNNALYTLLLLRKTNVNLNLIIDSLGRIAKAHPSKQTLMLALGDLHHEKDNSKAALSCYGKVLKTHCSVALQAKLHTQMGYLYFHLKQYDKMKASLELALKDDKGLPSTYNLLAYYYADTQQNLDTALMYVDRALETAPDCPHYLDTKGCVLKQLGKTSEAEAIFKKAAALAPKDTVILQHLNSCTAK